MKPPQYIRNHQHPYEQRKTDYIYIGKIELLPEAPPLHLYNTTCKPIHTVTLTKIRKLEDIKDE